MFLIMSAAYIDQELQSEFGAIPPSFLPLGNKRLFQHQVSLCPTNVTVYLSIPESYSVSKRDAEWLEKNNVRILPIPDGLNLGESVVAAYNLSDMHSDSTLSILYGDTLFTSLEEREDIICVSSVSNGYHWAEVGVDLERVGENSIFAQGESNQVVNGYFCFSNAKELMRSIVRCKWNFLAGLSDYHQKQELELVVSDSWLDFGHVNTYYKSKANFTTQRAFNQLLITPNWIEKTSNKDKKIYAEANWFESIPDELRLYTPQYLGSKIEGNKVSYKLEYLYFTALNELYVFAELPSKIWRQILSACFEFLSKCQSFTVPFKSEGNNLAHLFGEKTQSRLLDFCQSRDYDMSATWVFNNEEPVSIIDVLQVSEKYLPVEADVLNVLHGDFCFSNILYDFRTNRIKAIDPRGMTPQADASIYGDVRYDLAKLSHSVLGMYDWIIAGYYDVDINGQQIRLSLSGLDARSKVQQLFIEMVDETFALTEKNLYAMQIQLFLSMLPLHADDLKRQDALFANAFRLYHELIKD